MKRTNLALAIYFAAVFVCGAAAGIFAYRLYDARQERHRPPPPPRSPEEYRKKYLEEMKTRLGLNADQLSRLEVILDETREKYRQAREKQRPEMKAIQDDQVAKINAILNEAQRQEYAKMREEREKRMKEGKKEGRRPPEH